MLHHHGADLSKKPAAIHTMYR